MCGIYILKHFYIGRVGGW